MEDPLPASHLSTYLFCQRKLYLEENYGLKPPRTQIDLKHAILNEALRYTNRAEPGVAKSIKEPMPHSKVADLYYDSNRRSLQEALINHKDALMHEGMSIIETHKAVWQDLKQATKARVENTYEFMTKNRVYGNDLWWQLIPKITFNLNLRSERLGAKMTLYRVDNYPHSAVPYVITKQEPPEKGVWHSHRYELVLAMLLLAEQGLIVQEGVVLYKGGLLERRMDITPDLQEQLQERLASIKAMLASNKLPERTTNKKKCERCPLRERCYDDHLMDAKRQERGL